MDCLPELDGGFSTNDKIAEDTEDYSYDDDSDIDGDENWSELINALNDEPGGSSGGSSASNSDKSKVSHCVSSLRDASKVSPRKKQSTCGLRRTDSLHRPLRMQPRE